MKTRHQAMQGDGKMFYQRLIIFDKTNKFFDISFAKQKKCHILTSTDFTCRLLS